MNRKYPLSLFFVVILSFFSVALKAQVGCATCRDGHKFQHDTIPNYVSQNLSPNITPNGNNTLGTTPSYVNENVCGLNYITESIVTQTRETLQPGSGFPATMTLPNCLGAPIKAYLYWGCSYYSATPRTYSAQITNPSLSVSTYPATLIGTGPAKCWGETGTAAYRTDITASVSAGGVYSIALTGSSTSSEDKEIDGMTLVYVYNSGGAYSGSIALWDGNYVSTSGGSLSETFSGINVCAASGTASAFAAQGDMQSNVLATNTDTYNGTAGTFNNNFWNTNVLNTSVTAAQTTTTFSTYTNNSGDCYSWILAGLYWQNTTCVVCNTSALTLTTTFVNPTCGNSNGSATAVVTGGTAPYTYKWTPGGQTTATATGLSAGSYTVTVTDAEACSPTLTAIVVLTTTTLNVTAAVTANDKCSNSNNGSATSNVTGGTAPYTYAWTPTGGTNSTATGLTAGTYTVTIKDKNGCSGTASVTITAPPPLTANTVMTAAGCGINNGTATVTAGGGTAPYTYSWNPSGQTTATATGLSAGSYTVTVTDNNSCTTTSVIVVTSTGAITVSISASTGVLCNGGNTGTATSNVVGGSAPYTYAWTPTGGTNAIGTGLSAGNYTVAVTDKNGCTGSAIVTITQPTALLATMGVSTGDKCNGGNNGSATVTASGGTPAYTYAWAPNGGTNATGTGLTAGTYTVTVKDNNGCSTTATVVITQPTPLTATTVMTQANCGNPTGTATVTAGGGTGPYTYSWNPTGQTTAIATGLSAGSYTVTVTDNNSCTTTSVIVVTSSPGITVTMGAPINDLCNGGNNGNATVTVTGGSAPYTYAWTPIGGTNATGSGLLANTYTVTVTDNKGCTGTATVTITQPAALVATMGLPTNVSCNGGNNGSATVTVTGGTGPYTYAWTPIGGTNATGTGLTAGSYTVNITDNNGCPTMATVIIGQPGPLTLSTTVVAANCNLSDGSATAIIGGGVGPYTYSWNPSAKTTATATGLSANTYTVTVTDNNGCKQTATAVVNNLNGETVTINVVTNVSCFNGANGSISINVVGGVGPYTYLWTPSGQTNAIATGLSANTYSVTVTDNSGCTSIASATITQPTALVATMGNQTPILCNGGTASATVTVTGGTTPYTYAWTPNGGNTATGTGLTAGSYTVNVTDNNGCTTSATINITQPTALAATMGVPTDPSCNGGNNGSVTVTVTGGTGPYTYAWTPIGGNTATGSGLTAGSYTVTVTDNNGCIITSTVIINQPAALNVTTTEIDANCNLSDGSATANVIGGTGPYTYSWNPSAQATATATGLSASTYTVTVTDNNGCTQTATAVVNNLNGETASINVVTNVSCFNGANGSISINVIGGVAPYTYLWTPSAQTNATATGLSANTYSVTVTDNSGCTSIVSATITEPAQLVATMGNQTPILCNGGTASATVTVTGGTTPYTYAWTPIGGAAATGTGLTAGSYTVNVTDNNGCTTSATINITEPAALAATMGLPTDPSCNGGNNGSVTVTVTGGTGPYTYAWTPIGGNTATGSGLTAGSYTVTVTDNNGCIITSTVIINQPTALNVTTTEIDANCNHSDGSATANVVGGTGPYTYSWNPSAQVTATATGLSANTYTVTVTDNNGCVQTATAIVNNLNGETATIGVITNVSCAGGANGSISVNVVGGTAPYTYLWTPSAQTNATATGLSANTYSVTVTDNNGCTSIVSGTITQPAPLVATMGVPTQILCNGGTASVTVTVSGGTSGYGYNWTPNGGNTATGTGLTAGSYTVNVTDANGCISSATVNITQPVVLTAAISATTNVSCSGGNNGSLTVTATNGTPAYVYSWSPSGGSNATANTLTAGPYTVTVTDANGCTVTATGTIAQPNALQVTATSTQTSCNNTGTATATPTGGTSPYKYSWSPSLQTNATATGLSAGTYTVTVTDNNGCTATTTATVTSLAPVTATMGTIVNVSCFGGNNGTATVTAAAGTAPYTYAWTPNGGAGATGTGLSAGNYTVTVTDNNGCTTTASATVAEPTALLATASSAQQSVCSGQPASLSAIATGGTPVYAYSWAPAGGSSSTASVKPLVTTTYTVTVTDANGCITHATVTVFVNPALSLVITGGTAMCPGGTATLTAYGSGGDGIYSFTWSTGATTQSITVMPTTTTTYNVTLSDGCFSNPVTLPVPVTINPLPNVKFQADVPAGCAPLCTQFRDMSTVSSGGIASWVWNFGNSDSLSIRNPVYCYDKSGQYSVTLTVTSDSGCSSTLSVLNMITVYSHPNASFTYSPNPVTILTPTVQFTDNSNSQYPISQWYWTFGDQSDAFSTFENPTHTYQDTGIFCAHLEVVDIHGCIDSTTDCIDIQPNFTFYIPDAFTPNSDDINDVFMPKGSFVKSYEMYIYDRWGMQLFHSTDISNGWNGCVKGVGTVCQEDTYVYLINVTDSQGNMHNYTGKVSLVK